MQRFFNNRLHIHTRLTGFEHEFEPTSIHAYLEHIYHTLAIKCSGAYFDKQNHQ